VVNRCGVVAGPWQMGRVDQGVFTFWLLMHHFDQPLTYIGFGGSGKQVRDLLHVYDLVDLLDHQLLEPDRWSGVTVNVGGGPASSLSLVETTEMCRELTGREVPIDPVLEPRYGDVRIYVSDCELLYGISDWRPRRRADQILEDTWRWIVDHADTIAGALGIGRPVGDREA
jgi:CDP-paratose 2-epimerase